MQVDDLGLKRTQERCDVSNALQLLSQRNELYLTRKRRDDGSIPSMRDEHDAALRPRSASSMRNAQCAGHIAKR